MIILGIDTSGRDGSVALACGSGERFELLGAAPIAGGTYSAQLIPAIADLLAGASLAKVRSICWPSPPVPDRLPDSEWACRQ